MPQVPFTLEKKPGPEPLKSGPDQYILTVYTRNNQIRLNSAKVDMCKSRHARNHRKARQAHMKKMVRKEHVFTQRFRTAKGVRTRFGGVLGPQPPMAPKPEKSKSGSIS